MSAPQNSRRDFTGLVKTTKALLVAAGAGMVSVIGYATASYVKDVARTQSAEATAPLVALPPKVQTLEEFKGRQEAAQAATAAKLEAVANIVTALKATAEANQISQDRVNARVLDQLDKIERRSRNMGSGTQP